MDSNASPERHAEHQRARAPPAGVGEPRATTAPCFTSGAYRSRCYLHFRTRSNEVMDMSCTLQRRERSMLARQHTGGGRKLVALLAIGTLACVGLRTLAEPPVDDGGGAKQSSIGQATGESSRPGEQASAAEAEEQDSRESPVAPVSPEGWACSVPCVWTEMRVCVGDLTIASELHQCIAEGRRVTVVIGASEGRVRQSSSRPRSRIRTQRSSATTSTPGDSRFYGPVRRARPRPNSYREGTNSMRGASSTSASLHATRRAGTNTSAGTLLPHGQEASRLPLCWQLPEIPGQKLMGCNYTYDYPRPGVKVLTGCGCYYAEPAPKR